MRTVNIIDLQSFLCAFAGQVVWPFLRLLNSMSKTFGESYRSLVQPMRQQHCRDDRPLLRLVDLNMLKLQYSPVY